MYDVDAAPTSFSHEVEVMIGEVVVTVEVNLTCTGHSTPPSGMWGPPEFYDPGDAAEFDLDSAVVSVENRSNRTDTVKLTPDLFWSLLGDKAQIAYDQAYEAAQDSGEF